MPESLLYDIFISYSRKDESFVHQLTGKLDEWGFSYWIDVSGIESGDVFKNNIVTAIKSSKVILFVSSEASNESPWTVKEINYALHKQKPIIPIRIDKAEYNETLQFDLNVVDYVDCTKSTKIQQGFERLYSALQHHFPNHKRQVAQSDNIPETKSVPFYKKTVIRNICIALACLIALGLGICGIWHATHKQPQQEFQLKINKTGWDEYELKGKVKQLTIDYCTLTDTLVWTEVVEFTQDGRIMKKIKNGEERMYKYYGDTVFINNGDNIEILKYTDFGEIETYASYSKEVAPSPDDFLLNSHYYVEHTYDEKHQIKTQKHYIEGVLRIMKTNYVYNSEGFIVEYEYFLRRNEGIYDETYIQTYEYDANNNIIKEEALKKNRLISLGSSLYTYNNEGYVSSETRIKNYECLYKCHNVYEYDQNGNYTIKITLYEPNTLHRESSKEKRTIIYY